MNSIIDIFGLLQTKNALKKSCFPPFFNKRIVSKWTCIDDFKAETSNYYIAEFFAKLVGGMVFFW